MTYDRPLDPPEDKRREAYHCTICDGPIYVGEDYFNVPGLGICCEVCIHDAKCYDAEAPGPDPDEYYDSMREEDF